MADHEDDDFKMALKMSMQLETPEPKRSKPWENSASEGSPKEESEIMKRRVQRNLMAAAAEKRMMSAMNNAVQTEKKVEKDVVFKQEEIGNSSDTQMQTVSDDCKNNCLDFGLQLSPDEANQLFSIVFGGDVTKGILAQWSNQGIRFSPDRETSMGLVQHEGGPCGVLAAIQAYVLKHLLFPSEERSFASKNHFVAPVENLTSFPDKVKSRALIRGMAEILFLCGNGERAVIANLSIFNNAIQGSEGLMNDVIVKALEGFSIQSGSDLQRVLRVESQKSKEDAIQRLEAMLPVFNSRMGALLFLISALLSRGLDCIQAERDDPSQPLVTAPFGHASQEIVNLLLCGEAVAHLFDGQMDLGGGMSLKGISNNVEVGFLTLLESLNFCKVGQFLKCPKWPIWVVGSESHYTVLFALDSSVQDENEFERRESQIRRAFDARDQSGGGGFISVESFHQVLKETNVSLPIQKMDSLCSSGFIVWSEFWQTLLDLDNSLGGLKDSSGLNGKKVFNVYHFNGIAKSVPGSEVLIQKPSFTPLRVSVPPKWTPEEFLTLPPPSGSTVESSELPPPQHAPLVDCIRTRWPRAVCNWVGDSPSIV
ncbi:ubiquitin carboxyl-terminal hydrolase MINDY-3-like [Impatiens glandulifera]|uniref:ubiquitin carboxyl-terminal hydrolase MINDY-3-like n=1 Tax=Impatiens glandulifera TaxID=253017 RepID=UPI001FB071AE|nr:ubiquitin carboxyl-terminal hydrolase MINDY-3-like [Impatiens glandulifera]